MQITFSIKILFITYKLVQKIELLNRYILGLKPKHVINYQNNYFYGF